MRDPTKAFSFATDRRRTAIGDGGRCGDELSAVALSWPCSVAKTGVRTFGRDKARTLTHPDLVE